MSFFSNLWSWAGRLFGGRPDPTQALREELARHRPTGAGPKTPAPSLKTEPTPYPRGGAPATAPAPIPAPSVLQKETLVPAPLIEPPPAPARAEAQEKPEPPALSPSSGPISLESAPSGAASLRIDEARRFVKTEEAALDIPEPAAPSAELPAAAPASPPVSPSPVSQTAAEPAAPAPPPILPPISLLAPPQAEPRIPSPAPDPQDRLALNDQLGGEAQPEGMMKMDFAPAAAPLAPPVLPLDFEEDQEDLIDLSLVDEDMEALDARTLTRARPLLAAPPLDMLVARWRAALSRMQGPEGAWALFKHGTVVLFEIKPRNAEAEAKALLKAQIAPRLGAAPEPEVTALPNGGGWLVGGDDPRLFTYVAPEEASSATPPAMIGRLGRAKRDEDARDLEITHIENDPFWRPPED